MAPVNGLVALLLLLPSWSTARTVYMEGTASWSAVPVYQGSPLTVISRGSRVTSGGTTGLFTAQNAYSYSSHYLVLTWSNRSYIADSSAVVYVYDGPSRYSNLLRRFTYSDFRGTVQPLISTQYNLYIRVDVVSNSLKDFHLEMTLTSRDSKNVDHFDDGYHGSSFIDDYETQTILCAGYFITTPPGSDYGTYYANGGLSTDRYFDVTFSPDSYIASGGVVLYIRDGSSNYSRSLASYTRSTDLAAVSTTQWAAYVNVEVFSGTATKDYFLNITLTPRRSGDSGSPAVTAAWAAGLSSLVVFILVFISVAVVVARRRRPGLGTASGAATRSPYPATTVGTGTAPAPVYPPTAQGYPSSTTQGYPSTTQGHPSTTQGYPTTTQGLPTTQGYPSTAQGYLQTATPTYPTVGPTYPTVAPGYPTAALTPDAPPTEAQPDQSTPAPDAGANSPPPAYIPKLSEGQ